MGGRTRSPICASFMAVALIAALAVVAPGKALAAPTYQNGFVAYGTGSTGWSVVNPDGSHARTITPSGMGYDSASEHVATVSYSPAGERVAFETQPSGATSLPVELWVAAPDGSGARRIATGVGGADRIAWSPDGWTVYFASNGVIESVPANGVHLPVTAVIDPYGPDSAPQVTSRGDIFVARNNAEGTHLAVLRPGDPFPRNVADDGFGWDAAAVSPDGTRIAGSFAMSSNSGSFNTQTVYVDEIGNSHYTPVATVAHDTDGIVGFAPSGDIIYPDQTASGFTLMVVPDDPDATPRALVSGSGRLRFVDWTKGPSNLGTEPIADRVGGTDRVDTVGRASQWLLNTRGHGERRASTPVLARSDTFPDALAGTPLAIQAGGPLLLTPSTALDPAVGTELQRILPHGAAVYLLGGTAALSPAIAQAVTRLGFAPQRLGGPDRYATAVAIATAISGVHPESVLLATGTNFPDALTAGVAAGQDRYSMRNMDTSAGGVVVLTDGAEMPAVTRAYLKSLDFGPAPVALYTVGGPATAAIDSAFPAWPGLTRLAGADRYATAAKVATSYLFGPVPSGRYWMAGIATGLNFPDAMSGGALVGAQGGPLLLAGPTGLSPEEKEILTAGRLSGLAVIGGASAVSQSVFTDTANTAFGLQPWLGGTNRTAPPLP